MPLVAYTRVSTGKQQASGLGLEAQQEAIDRYAERTGEPIIGVFTEVESGAVRDRPQLAAALDLCRRKKAVLLIARLDRLSRSLAFIAQLLEAGVDVRAADVPEANRLTLQLLAVFAEHERQMIRDRTKAALAAAKARGVRLGAHGAVLAADHRREAQLFAEGFRGSINELRAGGCETTRELADGLNRRGELTREGGHWHPATVSRVLRRLTGPDPFPAMP
ncbi:recombinase family protein [Brevundimonas sp. DC300-4]|uniref:recombinase family protein n=1 Tax=Brevundimonas sp. DC300-4 TaxID=2804594 RepID=UPI003CE7231A